MLVIEAQVVELAARAQIDVVGVVDLAGRSGLLVRTGATHGFGEVRVEEVAVELGLGTANVDAQVVAGAVDVFRVREAIRVKGIDEVGVAPCFYRELSAVFTTE